MEQECSKGAIRMKNFLLAIWMSCFILAGCSEDLGKVLDDPEYQYRSGARIVVRVHLFKEQDKLQAAFEGLSNRRVNVLGWAIHQRNIGTREPNFCDIFVMETPYGNDDNLAVWGHELKHCLEGKWHTNESDR